MYELSLADLVDEDGLVMSYYHFEAVADGIDEWPWLHGVKFSSPPTEALELKVDLSDPDAGEFADCIGSCPPLMTAKLRKALEACGVSNIEYFAVAVAGAEKFDEFPDYFAFNVIGKTLSKAALPAGCRIARNSGMLAVLFVDDVVREAIATAGIDTLRFTPVSG